MIPDKTKTTIKPNFLIIGANKAGTTSLHFYLDQHPEIFMATHKEPMYFTYQGQHAQSFDAGELKTMSNQVKSESEYLNLFSGANSEIAIGESSTAYLANPQAAERIKVFNPGMKIIAILRNPVSRAFSNYLMYRRWGIERKSFSAVINEEMNGSRKVGQGQQYLALGLYAESIKTYLKHFGNDHVRVFLYDDLLKNPETLLKNVFIFLGVTSDFRVNIETQYNTSAGSYYYWPLTQLNEPGRLNKVLKDLIPAQINVKLRTKPAIRPEEKKILQDYFRNDIEETAALTGKDLSSWLIP